jgi:hypothetical protein
MNPELHRVNPYYGAGVKPCRARSGVNVESVSSGFRDFISARPQRLNTICFGYFPRQPPCKLCAVLWPF